MPGAASGLGICRRGGAPFRALFWASLAVAWTAAAPACALDPQKSISQFTHTAWTAQDGIAGPVRAIAQTRDGYLWLGTEAGLYRVDGLRFVLWEPIRGGPRPSSAVWSLCAARDGSLWIGLGSGGIGRIRGRQLRCRRRVARPAAPARAVPDGGAGRRRQALVRHHRRHRGDRSAALARQRRAAAGRHRRGRRGRPGAPARRGTRAAAQYQESQAPLRGSQPDRTGAGPLPLPPRRL